MNEPIIKIEGLKNHLGDQWVHSDVNLTVEKGEILAIIGGSGSGKTTILRSVLMLQKPTAGKICVFGEDIAMDPELLFLDEPTSGLDPLGSRKFDELIVFLRDALNLTVVIVSHDIESLRRCTDRVAFIGDGKVLAIQPINELMHNLHPMIAEYFSKT